MSAPITSQRSNSAAILVFVPTPSMDVTSTGSRYPASRKSPPNSPPVFSTPSRNVERTRPPTPARIVSFASMSTPASRYVSGSRAPAIDVALHPRRLEREPSGRRLGRRLGGVDAREARKTEIAARQLERLDESVHAEVAETVRLDLRADPVDRQA